MSAQELARIIGKQAMVTIGGMKAPVTILDAREWFGRTDYLVRVIGGSGQSWVSSGKVELI
jgi:hypothetical protein